MKDIRRWLSVVIGMAALLYSAASLFELIAALQERRENEGFAIRVLHWDFSPVAYTILHVSIFVAAVWLLRGSRKRGQAAP